MSISSNVHLIKCPFPCNEESCDCSFIHKSSLNIHIQTVHLQLKPHSCSVCSKSFNYVVTLFNHMTTVHQGTSTVEEEKQSRKSRRRRIVCVVLYSKTTARKKAVIVPYFIRINLLYTLIPFTSSRSLTFALSAINPLV